MQESIINEMVTKQNFNLQQNRRCPQLPNNTKPFKLIKQTITYKMNKQQSS